MSRRIPVFVYSADPLIQAGVIAQLRRLPSVLVVEDLAVDQGAVGVVVTDEVDDAALLAIQGIQRDGCPRIVVVAHRVDDRALLAIAEAGIHAVLRRADAHPEQLLAAIRTAAAGEGTMPPDLLIRLLDRVGELQREVLNPRGLTLAGLSTREIAVLRLVADGYDTATIADRLSYSERTIKNIIRGITTRLSLRNRSHAVAYAVRAGVI